MMTTLQQYRNAHFRNQTLFCRRFFSRLLLLLLLLVGIVTLLPNHPAFAAIRQLEEKPGQVVYQSRQNLVDQHGNRWQVIVFKRIQPNDIHSHLYLRLVGFPGSTEIDRSRPLSLITSLGQTLTADDASNQLFTDNTNPQPNIGQYDLQPVLPQLKQEVPLRLVLPTLGASSIVLRVSPTYIQEWQTLASISSSNKAKEEVTVTFN